MHSLSIVITTNNRSLKLPNGYGCVSKLAGKRRMPWMARKTVGWSNLGRQKYKYIGYFRTKEDALDALMAYNKVPYDIDTARMTFEEVFNVWKKERKQWLSEKNLEAYLTIFKRCERLHNRQFSKIRKPALQELIDDCAEKYSVKTKLKNFLKQLYGTAIDYDIVEKNYARNLILGQNTSLEKKAPFSRQEIDKIWELSKVEDFAKQVLILIYTGLRISEFLSIKTENVHIDEKFLVGGLKTEAGRNRVVPLSDKIIRFVEKLYNPNKKTLITNSEGRQIIYRTYYNYFDFWANSHGFNHTVNETRHTTATLLYSAKINEITIRAILGHAQRGITAKHYIHPELPILLDAINKI